MRHLKLIQDKNNALPRNILKKLNENKLDKFDIEKSQIYKTPNLVNIRRLSAFLT